MRSTIHGAFTRGYDTVLVADAHTTEDLTEYGAPTAGRGHRPHQSLLAVPGRARAHRRRGRHRRRDVRVSTYLLIPGAGGRASYWHLVVPILRTAGHTVVAPDLPAGDDDAGLDAYVDAALFALDGDGGADELVVVGQSLGAFTAPVVAARRRAAALILVAPMIPTPRRDARASGGTRPGQGEAYAAAARAEGRDPDAPFDADVVFLHDVPAAALRPARRAPGAVGPSVRATRSRSTPGPTSPPG